MVVAEQLVQEVQCLSTHQMLVLTVNKLLPALTRVPEEERVRERGGVGVESEGGREGRVGSGRVRGREWESGGNKGSNCIQQKEVEMSN